LFPENFILAVLWSNRYREKINDYKPLIQSDRSPLASPKNSLLRGLCFSGFPRRRSRDFIRHTTRRPNCCPCLASASGLCCASGCAPTLDRLPEPASDKNARRRFDLWIISREQPDSPQVISLGAVWVPFSGVRKRPHSVALSRRLWFAIEPAQDAAARTPRPPRHPAP
jgi:hypothetical protein